MRLDLIIQFPARNNLHNCDKSESLGQLSLWLHLIHGVEITMLHTILQEIDSFLGRVVNVLIQGISFSNFGKEVLCKLISRSHVACSSS